MSELGIKETLASVAYINGRQAGKNCLSPSLNQYAEGTAEHTEWERGRMSATTEQAATLNKSRPCNYHRDLTCNPNCGGNGHCLEVA